MRQRLFIFLMAVLAPACLGGGGKNNKPPAIPPAAPTTLAATESTSARIDLTWIDASDNEREFLIERSDDGGATYVQVGTSPMNIQGFTDLGLLPNKVYWYRVAAWNGKGPSAFTTPATATTKHLKWTLVPAGASDPAVGRFNHSAIYDAIGTRMIVFGGWDDSLDVKDEVWSFDLSAQAIPAQPWALETTGGVAAPKRFGHSAVYDSVHRRMIVFGGQLDGTFDYSNLVYVLNLDDSGSPMQWSQPVPSGTPPSPRAFHTAVYDADNRQMIVYGGTDGGFVDFDDVHILSFPTVSSFIWSTPGVGARPLRRSQHVAVQDPIGDRMVVFGGLDQEAMLDGTSLNNETWTFTSVGSALWTQLFFPGTPGFRMGHSAVYDSTNRRMVVYGGASDQFSTLSSEAWALRLDTVPTWSILNPTVGTPAPGRSGHAAVYDSGFKRIVIYGGMDDVLTPFNETWIFEE